MRDKYEYFGMAVADIQSRIINPQVRDDFLTVAETLRERLVWGDEKYGEGSWTRHDMLMEYELEQLDAANYCILKWMQIEYWLDDRASIPETIDEIRNVQNVLLHTAMKALDERRNMLRIKEHCLELGIPASNTGENRVGVDPGQWGITQ